MNYDTRLQRAAKTQRLAIGWALGLAFLAIVIALATFHVTGKHHHVHMSHVALYTVAILAGGAVAAYAIIGWSDGRIAWLADRAFLTRLYISSGFPRHEAERLAHRKIQRGP